MAKGKVKWFNDVKGFGFITNEDGSGEVYVHYTALAKEIRKGLKEGDELEFDVETGDKGPKAANVKKAS